MIRTERIAPSGPPVTDEDNLSTFELPSDGFFVDVLPDEAERSNLATGSTETNSYAIAEGYWYSITVEVICTSSGAPNNYVYRNSCEVYRDEGGSAVLFFEPATAPVEEPAGAGLAVTLGVSGGSFTVALANTSGSTVHFAIYYGFTRKPKPA